LHGRERRALAGRPRRRGLGRGEGPLIFYYDKRDPRDFSHNRLSLYFGKSPSSSPTLWLRVIHVAADWLDYAEIELEVDGKSFVLAMPEGYPRRSGGNNACTEWCDLSYTQLAGDAVDALARAQAAVIRLRGRGRASERELSGSELESIRMMYEARETINDAHEQGLDFGE
jgi:hypothetical protein